jgi:hypothetical protein
MPRPKKPFSQRKGAGCRRCGHRQNHSKDNCPAKGVKCFSVYFKVTFFVVNTAFLCPGFVKFIVNCSKKSFVLLFIYGNGSNGLVDRTKAQDVEDVDIARTIQRTIAQQKE